VANIFSRMGSDASLFRNEAALAPDYLPDAILHREAQVKEIAYAVSPATRGRKPQNAIVIGPPGTGKTCCCRHVLSQLAEYSGRSLPIYINCWEYTTRHAVLTKVAEALGQAMPRRGIATDEILARIAEIVKNTDRILVVVLDEVDRLLASSESKVLYDLTRAQEVFSARVGVIGVTNDAQALAKLDNRIRSSLASVPVNFEAYTPAQLKDILRERAKLALADGVLTEEVIPLCAAFGARAGGDARIAIECLRRAAQLAESEGLSQVTAQHVRAAYPQPAQLRAEGALASLGDGERALVQMLKEKGELSSGQIEAIFEKSGMATDRSVRNYIARLESLGLIETEEIEGGRGKSRLVRLRLSG